MIYIIPSLAHFHCWTLVGEALLYIVLVSLQFEEKEGRPGFCRHHCGFLWIIVLMVCFLHVIVSVFMCFISFYCR